MVPVSMTLNDHWPGF